MALRGEAYPAVSSSAPPTQASGMDQPRHIYHRLHSAKVLLPALISVAGHIGLCFLLLSKWELLEVANGGHPLVFNNITQDTGANSPGPSWAVVFSPSWLAQGVVACLAITTLITRGRVLSWNSRLLHVNSLCQSFLVCIFQLLLMIRLTLMSGSWLLVFSPAYISMALQTVLHYVKELDSRGRRPGFPFGIQHLLALAVSMKLEGLLEYEDSSWASVLWPLWGLGGICGATLAVSLCCGVPLLLRRELHTHMAAMLFVTLLLLGSIFTLGLLAVVRLTVWLDGSPEISAADIMVPYLCVFTLILFILTMSLVFIAVSTARRSRMIIDDMDDHNDSQQTVEGLLTKLPPPKTLVRVTSTFFRRISNVSSSMLEELSRMGDEQQGLPTINVEGSNGDEGEQFEEILGRDEDSDEMESPRLSSTLTKSRMSKRFGEGAGKDDDGAASSHTSVTSEEARESSVCWVCYEGPREAVLMECGHGGVCYSCAKRIFRKKGRLCPICRQRITTVLCLVPSDPANSVVRVQRSEQASDLV